MAVLRPSPNRLSPTAVGEPADLGSVVTLAAVGPSQILIRKMRLVRRLREFLRVVNSRIAARNGQ
jgi:hypothetical protein